MALSFPSIAIGFGAGLAAALAFSWLSMSDEPTRDEARTASEAVPDDDEPGPDDDVESGKAPSSGAGVPAGTTAQLRAEVARLTKELAVERARRESVEGKPIPFPAEVPERHTEKGLMTSVRAALAEMKVSGDVTAIDCTEYPCIASVRVQGKLDIDRFLKTPALAAYAGDQPSYNVSGFADGENVLVVGFNESTQTMVASDDPAREEKLEQLRAQLAAERERRGGRVRALFQAGMDELPPRAAPPP